MSYVNDLSKMFCAMDQATESLLSDGQTKNAVLVLSSADILRAHFEKYMPALQAASLTQVPALEESVRINAP